MFDKGTSDVLADVCPKRYPEKQKRQTEVNCPSSASVKKFKWNGTVHTSDEIGNVENQLASTRSWRQLLFNKPRNNCPLVRSEEIFRENIFVLLYGIDKCAGNPAQWKRDDTNFFFNKIVSFVGSWKKQLLKENIDRKKNLMKGKPENKRDLVTNVLNVLTNVYYESLKFITFSATQKKAVDSKLKELKDLRSTFEESGLFVLYKSSSATMLKNKDNELNEAKKQADDYREELRKAQDSLEEAHSKFNESSFAIELKNKCHELNEVWKKADNCREELRKTQGSLKEAHLKFNKSLASELLKNKNRELNEARKRADEYLEELRKAQNSLKEAHLKLNDLMPINNPLTQVDSQVILDGCLQDKEKQLNELKKQLDWSAKKQKETEGELTETREQLQSFVAKSREMTQTKQKDMNKKLSDIQTLLLMKNPNYRPSCRIENESLNKEEKIFKDIKAIIEYEIKSSNNDNNCKQNTNESALETSSSASLRISEYEMHLVTLMAAFLKVTPFPVSSHTIYSYLANIDNVVDLQFVESLLRKFPSIFKEVAGAPGSMEKYWIYLDLKPVITI